MAKIQSDDLVSIFKKTFDIKNQEPIYVCKFDAYIAPIFRQVEEAAIPYWGESKRSFLHLPLRKDGGKLCRNMRPVLHFEKDHDRFILYCFFTQKEELFAYVFRFEGPGQSGEDGTLSAHCYHHCQLVFHDTNDAATKYKNAFNNSNSHNGFIPDSYPSFPLPAKNNVELMLALLISLYGWRDCFDRWATDPENKKIFEAYREEIKPFLKFK